MEQHEFCECLDKKKLGHHAMWDAVNKEVLDHVAIDSLEKALCSECFRRWVETERLKQVIHECLNWDWQHFAAVVGDLIKRFDLLEKWQKT